MVSRGEHRGQTGSNGNLKLASLTVRSSNEHVAQYLRAVTRSRAFSRIIESGERVSAASLLGVNVGMLARKATVDCRSQQNNIQSTR